MPVWFFGDTRGVEVDFKVFTSSVNSLLLTYLLCMKSRNAPKLFGSSNYISRF